MIKHLNILLMLRLLMFLCLSLMISCNGEKVSDSIKIIEYPFIDSLEVECKKNASNFYTLHDVKISKFYKITQEVGCDYNGDNNIDSIYILTPVNQVYNEPDCFETTEIDTSIILIFKNSSSEQKIFRAYKNLFCPLSPNLIYRELVFKNEGLILKKDFGFGNGRKVYNELYFSWKKDDLYADSVITEEFENGGCKTLKQYFFNTKLSSLNITDCDLFLYKTTNNHQNLSSP